MPPGKYPHWISIEKPTVEGKDEIGNQTVSWNEVTGAWARIEPLKGKEYWAAAQAQGEITHKISLRPPDIPVLFSYEIVFEGRRFEIKEPPRDIEERGVELVIMCKERL